MTEFDTRRQVFRELHREGCFALPNPWDVGTARYLRHLGFSAIATQSAGYAFSRGVADGSVGRDEMLAHIKELVEATDLPVNADFENGYADDPDEVASNVRLCVTTGVAGLSIEDAADRRDNSIYELPLAVERLHMGATFRIVALRPPMGATFRIVALRPQSDTSNSAAIGNVAPIGLRYGRNRRLGERVPGQHASNFGPPSSRRLNEHTLHGRPRSRWSQEVAERVAAPGGPRGDRALVFARCLRIASITSCSVMNAITFISEPQIGHTTGSTS